eukprot:1158246-Pelagomonas_calceolata.AAC.4
MSAEGVMLHEWHCSAEGARTVVSVPSKLVTSARLPQHHEFDAHGGTIVAGRPGTPLVHGKAAQRACLENELPQTLTYCSTEFQKPYESTASRVPVEEV